MPDLRDRLTTLVGETYSIERELGGGAMSRVFVAEEIALERKVVVKVLSPELAEGLSATRFVREIKLAARLQQANIMPVLRAGELDGLPYYTMPFVAGESLRSRLEHGSVPAADALAILRDVAKALAYAHAEGVVHRDIKPENILISAGTAVVADFGIAKAISASRHEAGDASRSTLTGAGMAVGTPAYMAPEQAAGDPLTDARADLYAWGVIAYELLAGKHPFDGAIGSQALIRAHMSQQPMDLQRRAPDTPVALSTVVMRCLAKAPEHRPTTASAILEVLDSVAHAAVMTTAPRSSIATASALGLYALVFALVASVARLSIAVIGLPAWVFGVAVLLLILGLPVVAVTALMQHRRGGQQGRLTWRRVRLGGASAFGALALVVAMYMTLRQLGVGPFGSLIGAKSLAARDRILIADLHGPASDTTLGAVFAAGLRAALSESKAVRLVSPERAGAVLGQMRRRGVSITGSVAREVAERSSAKAILDGDVAAVGRSYTLTVRLLPTRGGEEPLATLQETASDDADFTPATGRLAKRLRARIGESLRSVNAAPALADVTTGSLPALRKYTAGLRAVQTGDFFGAIRLFGEAAAIDSGFAMAYQSVGSVIAGFTGMRQFQSDNLQRAFDHRARATIEERLQIEYTYWSAGPTIDADKAERAALALGAIDSIAYAPALSTIARQRKEYARAIQLERLAFDVDSNIGHVFNLILAQGELGPLDSVRTLLNRVRATAPGHPLTLILASQVAVMTGNDSAALAIAHAMEAQRMQPLPEWGAVIEAAVWQRRGRLRDARRAHQLFVQNEKARGVTGTVRQDFLWEARGRSRLLGDSAHVVALLDSALALDPWETSAPRDRDYAVYIQAANEIRRPDLARRALALLKRDDPLGSTLMIQPAMPMLEGLTLRAEGNYRAAIDSLRYADRTSFAAPTLLTALLGQTFDAAGQLDSAVVYYEKYVESTSMDLWLWVDCELGAPIRKRLGEIYEERGSAERARGMYASVVNQLRYADPDLQGIVADLRSRMARLERH